MIDDSNNFREIIPFNKTILCLDLGKKRIGLAISDVNQKIASPYDVLEEKTTVLSVALNAQSPEWLTAVEAILHDAKDEEEKKVSKIHTKPYGNPSTGSCLPNEMKVQIQGIAGR